MSKNLEIMKAIESLKTDQNNTYETSMLLIDQLEDGFVEEEGLCSNNGPGKNDDNYDIYYAEIGILLGGLRDNLALSLENFSKIASSYSDYNSSVEEVFSDQNKKNELIWDIINQLEPCTDEEIEKQGLADYLGEEEEDSEEEEASLKELLDKIKLKLANFEENFILLIKLYNQYSGNFKLSDPVSFFSNQEDLSQNQTILTLANRGIIID